MEAYVIYPIFSLNFVINNVIFYLLLAGFLTLLLGKTKGNVISNNWGIISESLFRTILLMIENVVGPKMSIYLPLFYSIFHIVLFSNLLAIFTLFKFLSIELLFAI